MKSKKGLIGVLGILALVAFATYSYLGRSGAVDTHDVASVSDSPNLAPSGMNDGYIDNGESPALEASFASGPTENAMQTIDLSKERPSVMETRRMYEAHASLRTDSVDNPDSDSNTRIRARMLDKMSSLADRHEQRKLAAAALE